MFYHNKKSISMNPKLIRTIVVITVSVLIYFVFIVPVFMDVKALREDDKKLKTALNDVREIISKGDALDSQYRDIPLEEREFAEKALPTFNDENILAFAKQIETIGTRSGGSIAINGYTTRFGNTDNSGFADDQTAVITLSFSFSGVYADLFTFLSHMERSIRFLTVTSLQYAGPIRNQDETFTSFDSWTITVEGLFNIIEE